MTAAIAGAVAFQLARATSAMRQWEAEASLPSPTSRVDAAPAATNNRQRQVTTVGSKARSAASLGANS
jgi:hypothetical protein